MEKLKKYLQPIIVVALFGEIYFYPFNSSLRISAGVIALNIIILAAKDISEYYGAIFSGITIFLTRSTIDLYFTNLPIKDVIQYNFPSVIYYLFYGFLALALKVRKHKENLLMIIFLLSAVDSLSNIVEAFIRNKTINFHMIQVIIFIGLSRSVAAYFIYSLYKNQELFILHREHQKRYSHLNILVSDIQAEMFYLKKSMSDIENVMSKSYQLYEKHRDDKDLQKATLDIAREVHEIKKDYYRVVSGFETFLKDFENKGTMTLKEMLVIIKNNTNRYLKQHQKDIAIHFEFQDDFKLKKYYNLFTILNNLIMNAIDACGNNGIIRVWEKSDQDFIYFGVEDNGEGIEEDILPYIFNPGFTTKYYDDTGKASTGIGLSHVQNIVEELHGNVFVKSNREEGTVFSVTLPKNSLIG